MSFGSTQAPGVVVSRADAKYGSYWTNRRRVAVFHVRETHIALEPLYDLRLERRSGQARIWMFTHSVQRNSKVGSGLVMFVHNHTIMSCSGLAGDLENTNLHLSSLVAIHDVMNYREEMLPRIRMEPSNIQVVICTSDLASLQSLGHPARQQSGQELRLAIMRLACGLIDQGLRIQIRWTPNESNIELLRQAKTLPLQATEANGVQCAPTQMAPATWRRVCRRLDMQAKQEFDSARWVGQHEQLTRPFLASIRNFSTTACRGPTRRS